MKNKKRPKGEPTNAVMSDHEKAIRIFFDWTRLGILIPNIELAFESFQDTKDSPKKATIRSEITDAIDGLMEALMRYREVNRSALEKERRRQKVVSIQEWMEKRTA